MDLATMKLAILQNSDVMEKNQYRIRIQRPKISKDLLVSFNAQKKGQILLPCVIDRSEGESAVAANPCNIPINKTSSW